LLVALSVPPILVFVEHAIGDRVQGNWPVIFYPAAAVAAAGLAAPIWRRLVGPSACLGFVITAVVYVHVVTGWPSLPGKRDPVSRQLFGWSSLAAGAEAAQRDAGAGFVAAEPYGLASELAWYLPPEVAVAGSGSHWALTTLPRAETGERPGILIRPEGYGPPDPADWRDWVRLSSIARTSGDVEFERYSVFLVRAAGASSRAVWLPRP
jgi:hypothetical protein